MALVEYMMSFRHVNGNMQTKSIKDVEAESKVLVRKVMSWSILVIKSI
jgi:hypothetical protein